MNSQVTHWASDSSLVRTPACEGQPPIEIPETISDTQVDDAYTSVAAELFR